MSNPPKTLVSKKKRLASSTSLSAESREKTQVYVFLFHIFGNAPADEWHAAACDSRPATVR